MAAYYYLRLSPIETALGGDLRLPPNRRMDRRVVFITHRARDGIDMKEYIRATRRSLLPWLDKRFGLLQYFGVFVGVTKGHDAHSHLIAHVRRQVPRIRQVWEDEQPSGAWRWSSASSSPLDVRAFRSMHEVQPWRDARPLRLGEVPDDRAGWRLIDVNVDHYWYLAAQYPSPGIPQGHKGWVERGISGQQSGFAAFRESWVDAQLRRPEHSPVDVAMPTELLWRLTGEPLDKRRWARASKNFRRAHPELEPGWTSSRARPGQPTS